jgi:hypothetical protein
MSILSNDVKPNGFGPSPGTFVPPVSSPSMPVLLLRRGIDPHSIAHKSLSKASRAILGAEILDGNVPVLNPTVDMVAKATGVSASYIAAARRLSPEQRQDVLRKRRPLVQRRAPSPVLNVEQRFVEIVTELGGVTAALSALAMIERR